MPRRREYYRTLPWAIGKAMISHTIIGKVCYMVPVPPINAYTPSRYVYVRRVVRLGGTYCLEVRHMVTQPGKHSYDKTIARPATIPIEYIPIGSIQTITHDYDFDIRWDPEETEVEMLWTAHRRS